jgi:hypothetical protein
MPSVIECFESAEGQAEFERWKQERSQNNKKLHK